MKNIRFGFYNNINSSIVTHYVILQNLIPDRPYDYLFERDRAKRKLDYVMKHGQEVMRQCNRIKISLRVSDIINIDNNNIQLKD